MNKIIRYIIIKILILLNIVGFSQVADINATTDKYSIVSKNTDSISFSDYFVDQNNIDSISKKYSNWHERAIAIEEFMISDCSVEIKIEGISRIVQLQNGEYRKLTPDQDTVDEAGYTFEKEFQDLNLLLFRVQWFEGNSYFLFNSKTGEKSYTIGRVYINPSNSLLISINDDIEAGYSSNGFELFEIGKDGKLFYKWGLSTSWAPENIKWIDNSTLIVKGYYYDETDDMKYRIIYKEIRINER